MSERWFSLFDPVAHNRREESLPSASGFETFPLVAAFATSSISSSHGEESGSVNVPPSHSGETKSAHLDSEVVVAEDENPFRSWIRSHIGRAVDKWEHYLDIYHRHFHQLRAKASPSNKVILYEIGVQHGGSLEMWRSYFGKDCCRLYGIDCDPRCAALASAKDAEFQIRIGDQGDVKFLQELCALPAPDIVIDDGGHLMEQQKLTLKVLWPHLKPGGLYLCEDTHTSYYPQYGGGLLWPDTFIEHSKRLVDCLHAGWCGEARLKGEYSEWCDSISFYDSVVVLAKKKACQVGAQRRRLTPGTARLF